MLIRILILANIFFMSCAVSKETRQRIAVIDTGLPFNKTVAPYICKDGHKDFTGTGIKDTFGHGTNIVGLIIPQMNPKTQCIVMIKFWNDELSNSQTDPEDLVTAYSKYLMQLKPAYLNMSIWGNGFFATEYKTLKYLLDHGTKVIVAAGNGAQDLSQNCNSYPACYAFKNKNFHVVSATDVAQTNYNGPVTDSAKGLRQCALNICMSGSSQSTANITAQLVKDGK